MKKLLIILWIAFFTVITFSNSSVYACFGYVEWRGTVDSDWENGANWEGGAVPSNGDRILIDDDNYIGNQVNPIISVNSSFNPSRLLAQDNVILTIGADITTSDWVQVIRGAVVNMTGGTFTVNGVSDDITIQDNNSQFNLSGGTVNINDDLRLNGDNDGAGANPTFSISGGTLNPGDDIRFQGSANNVPHLVISGGTVNVPDDVYRDGADVDIDVSGGTLILGDDLTMNNADDAFDQSGGTVRFDNTGTWTNNGNFTATGGTLTFNGTTTFVNSGVWNFDDVNINSGKTLTQSSPNINVSGNWTNTGGTYTAGTNKVTFNGTVAQSITNTAGEAFYDMEINNSSTGVTLNDSIIITNSLTLTDGIIVASTGNELIFNDNATVSGATDVSHVDGPVNKIGNDAFIFPTGDAGRYQPIEISAPGSITDRFEATYNYAAYGDLATMDPSLDHISSIEYWNLDLINGSPTVNVTLHWDSTSIVSGSAAERNDLRVAHYTGGIWANEGNDGLTGDSLSGSIVVNNVSSFSPFTFASISSSNPLPIALINFGAALREDVVDIYWSTASEVSNDYFTVEKSENGIDFNEVTRIDGAGNSNDLLNYRSIDYDIVEGISYYRLKQTDYNGTYTYSGVVSVEYIIATNTFEFNVYPNPAVGNNEIKLDINGVSEEEVLVVVYDLSGREYYTKVVIIEEEGSTTIALNPNNELAPGMYLVTATNNNALYNKKLIIR